MFYRTSSVPRLTVLLAASSSHEHYHSVSHESIRATPTDIYVCQLLWLSMKAPRYSGSRQKACDHCTKGKTKCQKGPTGCSRCIKRGLLCTYPQDATFPDSTSCSDRVSDPGAVSQGSSVSLADILGGQQSHPERLSFNNTIQASTPSRDDLSIVIDDTSRQRDFDFSDLNLACTINVDDITSRWLNTYVPVAGQVIKDYPPAISALIRRVLKSYVASAVRGHSGLPPFIHPSQTDNPASVPLATCLNMVRICQSPVPGSETTTADILQQEMSRIYERRVHCTHMELLATFQAYLIYAMALFLRLEQASALFLRQAMTNLQDLAWMTTRQGIICVAEQQHSRPKWEEWIVVEAKRRTLYVMYMFDDVVSKQEGIPTFMGVELAGLPAPGSKSLWTASTRQEWQKRYNLHSADWSNGGFCIDELWAIPPEMSEDDIAKRRSRVEQWLEDLDEFGMMIYAVTSCTHGI